MKLSMRTQLAYGIGQAGDTIPYCMFYTYFLYYLTDVVKINPSVAGIISLVAVAWDAITDPIIGYLSDNTKSKYGRRRPWMVISIIPLALFIYLIFAPMEVGEGLLNAYYVVFAALFWTCYTTYVIPYMSLGAEMTTDYNGRNYIRMYNMIGGGIFMLLCTSGPMVVLEKCLEAGFTERYAWGASGGIFGFIALICMFICWIATKGKENPVIQKTNAGKKESVITVIKETLQIAAYRKLCVMTFIFMAGMIVASSAVVYLLSYNCGLDEGQQSLYWLVYAIVYIVMVPIGSAIANKFGKKVAFEIGVGITSISCIVFYINGISTFTEVCIYTAILQLGSTVFWTNYLAFAYDVAEIDEYKNGKRREGSLCAVVSFAQKFGSAIAMYLTGTLLVIVGYDAELEIQTPEALKGICMLCTLAPAICGIIAMGIMAKYPVTRKSYDALVEAIELRKQGKEVDEEPFRNLLS